MRRRALFLAVVVAPLAITAVACGLDVYGSGASVAAADGGGPGEGGASLPPQDAATADGEARPEGGSEIPIGGDDDGGDMLPDAGIDAQVTDCGATVFADTFSGASVAPPFFVTGTGLLQTSSGNGYVRVAPTGTGSQKGGLWVIPGPSATSFSGSFRYYAQRPSFSSDDNLGDGFTLTWITSPNPTIATLGNAVEGGGEGIPRNMAGYAFLFDPYQNGSPQNDPNTPSFSIIKLDPTKGPGSYNWHVKSSVAYSGVYDRWLTVTVKLDKGLFSANIGTTLLITNQPVPSGAITALGFTGATGGADALGAFIDNVQLQLLDPTCP